MRLSITSLQGDGHQLRGSVTDRAKAQKTAINLALIGLVVWFLASHQEKIRTTVSNRDSIQYWAAGTLLVHENNPYSVPDVQALESSQGYSATRPLMLRTPPWSVWMVLPEGLLSSYWAWILWMSILLASLLLSMRIAWKLYGDSSPPPNVFIIVGYIFAPVAACLVAGQLGMVLLLGISLFLLLERDHPFVAGAALLLPMAKPHIFAPVWLILAIWVISRRKWSVLAGTATAFLLANGIALAFDPGIFSHYREMLHQQAIQNEFIPTLSGVIRAIFFRRLFWVQFAPMPLGVLWSVWFYSRNWCRWSWLNHGLTLLVVSLLTTPYSWITDEVVLLPAILQGVMWLKEGRLRVRSRVLLVVFALLDSLLLLMVATQVPPAHGGYFWSSLLWFAWYWYTRSFSRSVKEQVVEPAVAQIGS